MRTRLVKGVIITHIHFVHKGIVTDIIIGAGCIVAVVKVNIDIQKTKLINVLIIIFEVEYDDSLFRVSLLAPVFLGAFVGVVPKFVAVVALDVRLFLACSFNVAKGECFRVSVHMRCRLVVILIVNQQVVGGSHTG
jgi:hypothetical protein